MAQLMAPRGLLGSPPSAERCAQQQSAPEDQPRLAAPALRLPYGRLLKRLPTGQRVPAVPAPTVAAATPALAAPAAPVVAEVLAAPEASVAPATSPKPPTPVAPTAFPAAATPIALTCSTPSPNFGAWLATQRAVAGGGDGGVLTVAAGTSADEQDDTRPLTLRLGARVRLAGLRLRSDLNGRIAQVTGFSAEGERWVITVEGVPGQLRCKAENIIPLEVPAQADPAAPSAQALHPSPLPASAPPQVALAPAPWRIQANAGPSRPVGVPALPLGGEQRRTPSGKWQCDLFDRLALDVDPALAEAWGRYAHLAEVLATRHVRAAFGRLAARLHEAAARGPDGDLRAVLALAGADAADHEATMRLMQHLVREQVPAAHIARVGPEDFRTTSAATRRVSEQLMQGGAARAGAVAAAVIEGGEPEVEDAEWWPEDRELHTSRMSDGGALDFVDWHHERGLAGPAVLLVERVEAVPKDGLRHVLGCFGSACCDSGIPFIVVLGLQQPPQSRHELLEGEPLLPLRIVDALCAFEAGTVCAQLLERLAEDPGTLPLAPASLFWLRNQFQYVRRSFSATLRALALLCEGQVSRGPLAALCSGPLDGGTQAAPTCLLLTRCDAELVRSLRVVWPAMSEAHDDNAAFLEAARPLASKAAAEVIAWRGRLCSSLGVWDALLCAAEPLARHEVRLRRLCRLLSALWPTRATDAAESQELEDAGHRSAAELLQRCLQQLLPMDNEGIALELTALQALQQVLRAAGRSLDESLQRELEALGDPAMRQEELRKGIRRWLERVRDECWQPLRGTARAVLLEGIACQGSLVTLVERQLSGTSGSTAEALLVPLSTGRRTPGSDVPGDVTLLWRLLQGCNGRRVDIAALWRAFCDHSKAVVGEEGGPAGAARRRRFGLALAALHALGLHAPRAGGGAGGGGWRLHKRHFGRIWHGAGLVARPAAACKGVLHLGVCLDAEGSGQAPATASRSPPRTRRAPQGPTAATALSQGRSLLRRVPHRAPLALSGTKQAWAPQMGQQLPPKQRKRPKLFMGS